MKKLVIISILVLIVSAGFTQTRVSSDVSQLLKRGAASDTIIGDTIADTYYVKDFAEELKVYHHVDTVSHTANDTIEFGLQLSYDNTNWIEVDRDTVTVSSSHVQLQESSVKAPYWKTWIRNITTTAGATMKWEYYLLIDVNE